MNKITSNDNEFQHPRGGDIRMPLDQCHRSKFQGGPTWGLGMLTCPTSMLGIHPLIFRLSKPSLKCHFQL